jgi:hypothetical protein
MKQTALNPKSKGAPMRRNALVLALTGLAVACLAAAAVAGGWSGHATKASTADQIRQAEHVVLQATVDADIATLSRSLAPEFQLIDPFGSPESHAAYLDTVKEGVDFVSFKPISTIVVHSFGNAAVARFHASLDVFAGPDHLKHRAWVTDLFEQRNARWLLVWSQITPTPNNPELLIKALKAST